MLGDAVLINVAFGLAYWLRYEQQLLAQVDPANDAPYLAYLPFSLGTTLLLLLIFKIDGVYDRRRGRPWLEDVYRIANGTTTSVVILLAIIFLLIYFRPLSYSRIMFLAAAALIVLLLSVYRLIFGWVEHVLRRRGVGVERLLVVGDGDMGRAVMANVVARPDLGYQVIGFLHDGVDGEVGDIGRFKALGKIDDLSRVLAYHAADQVIITLPWTQPRKILELVRQVERAGARVRIVPDLFQLSLSQVDVNDLGGIPLIGVKEVAISRGGRLFKRLVDVFVAGLVVVLLSPLLALIALAIKLDSRGPVLFRQTRVGQRGRPFTIYKFRSMREGAEEEQAKLVEMNEASGPLFKMRNDPRLTRVGRILRRTSLDELPQFFNVLRGEMSLVGPRPPVPAEVEQYQPWHRQRLEVAPGITGLWQVSGRSDLDFDEMVLLDLYYIEAWSFFMDFQILLRTIPALLTGRGAY
jgi:exopolysaccharide biosynthesis polyprenyl glycosylphosphotransferase